MLTEIFKFEVRYHLKQLVFYVCLVLFFLLTFGAVTSDTVQIGGSIGNVNRNAPIVIMQFLLVFSIFGGLCLVMAARSIRRRRASGVLPPAPSATRVTA